MAGIELFVRHVLCVPHIVGYSFQIVGSLANRMLVETVKAGLVDDVDNSLFCLADCKRRVAGSHFTIGLYTYHSAEVSALLWIACGMSGHG